MTPLWVLVARKASAGIIRALDVWAPMVPPAAQAQRPAALGGRTQSPVSGVRGEAHDQPATGPGRGAEASSVAPLPGHHPDDITAWSAHPAHAWEFTDEALAASIDAWQEA